MEVNYSFEDEVSPVYVIKTYGEVLLHALLSSALD